MAPKFKVKSPNISYMTGHHTCFILDREAEVKEKEREEGEMLEAIQLVFMNMILLSQWIHCILICPWGIAVDPQNVI